MDRPGRAARYFTDLAEVQSALGLPLLGRLDAEPRFYQLADVLSRLTPDPYFSERLFRLVEKRPLRGWVVCLGGAGEEMPVTAGLAERAAIALGGPIVIARLDDASLEPARRVGLHKVRIPDFAAALHTVFPESCGARPSGIHNVYRVWGAEGDDRESIEPVGFVLASGSSAESRPAPDQVDPVVLVIPFRDEPRDRLVAEVEQLRATGYPLAGFVAIGPLGTADGQWDTVRSSDREETTPGAEAVEPELVSAMPRERIEVSQSWSELFGPHRRQARRRRIYWLILAVVILALSVALLIWRSRLRAANSADQAHSGWSAETLPPPASREGGAEPLRTSADPPYTLDVGRETVAVTDSFAADSLPVAQLDMAESTVVLDAAGAQPAEAGAAATEDAGVSEPMSARGISEPQNGIRDMVPTDEGPFAVLCGSYQREERAAGEVARLATLGIEASVFSVRLPTKGIWHRVIAGHDLTAADAQTLAGELLGSGRVEAARGVAANGWGKPLPDPAPQR